MKAIKAETLLGCALLLCAPGALAELSNQGMLDQVVSEFASRASSWQAAVMSAAMRLFWALGAISLAWTGGMLILRKADIGDFFAEFIRFILFFGFFLWLLRNGPAIAASIIQSLQTLGQQASGISSVTPSGIVDIGFMVWKQAIAGLSLWSPVDSFVGVALSAGIMLLLAAVAVNMLLILVSAWILMYAGIFFLGFGGSRWTSEFAINYYKTVLGVAVQLFSMILLVGIGTDLLSGFYSRMNKGTLNFEELGVMLVFCFALLMLVNKIPGLLSGIITGAGLSHSGIGNLGAGAIAGATIGAAGVAAAAGSVAGAAMVGSAQNVAGGVSAVKAAIEKAQAGAGGAEGAPPAAGFAHGRTRDDPGTSESPFVQAAGISPAASFEGAGSGAGERHAHGGRSQDLRASDATANVGAKGGLGRTAAVASGALLNLATGTGAVLKGKAEQMTAEFLDGVGDTFGGQVASAIRASSTPAQEPVFDGNSLSAPDIDSEVAAFVEKAKEPRS